MSGSAGRRRRRQTSGAVSRGPVARAKGETKLDEGNAICASVISMAHELGIGVVAEGVETFEQLSFLRTRGRDQLQGFLLSKPISAAEFSGLLRENDESLIRAVALRLAS